MRGFPKEISVSIGGLSKADGSPHRGEGMNGKSKGMVNSLGLTSERIWAGTFVFAFGASASWSFTPGLDSPAFWLQRVRFPSPHNQVLIRNLSPHIHTHMHIHPYGLIGSVPLENPNRIASLHTWLASAPLSSSFLASPSPQVLISVHSTFEIPRFVLTPESPQCSTFCPQMTCQDTFLK